MAKETCSSLVPTDLKTDVESDPPYLIYCSGGTAVTIPPKNAKILIDVSPWFESAWKTGGYREGEMRNLDWTQHDSWVVAAIVSMTLGVPLPWESLISVESDPEPVAATIKNFSLVAELCDYVHLNLFYPCITRRHTNILRRSEDMEKSLSLFTELRLAGIQSRIVIKSETLGYTKRIDLFNSLYQARVLLLPSQGDGTPSLEVLSLTKKCPPLTSRPYSAVLLSLLPIGAMFTLFEAMMVNQKEIPRRKIQSWYELENASPRILSIGKIKLEVPAARGSAEALRGFLTREHNEKEFFVSSTPTSTLAVEMVVWSSVSTDLKEAIATMRLLHPRVSKLKTKSTLCRLKMVRTDAFAIEKFITAVATQKDVKIIWYSNSHMMCVEDEATKILSILKYMGKSMLAIELPQYEYIVDIEELKVRMCEE